MKIRLIFFLSVQVLFFLPTSIAQEVVDPLHQIRVDVVYLASDYLEGRGTGTEGEQRAANYLAQRFGSLGLQPAGENGSWFQAFEAEYRPNPHETNTVKVNGINVIAYLDNKAKNTVVIGGHYDHLGMGHYGSRHVGEPAIHNGADDNASGMAALLFLAEQVQQKQFRKNNYLFIGFSGEELGLFGSKYFVKHPTHPLEKVSYMLNLDMVGRLNEEGVLVINGAGTSPAWKAAFESIAMEQISIQTNDSGIGPSDHTSFYLEGIPAIHFFTGQHLDYHKPEDDSALVNFEGIKLIGEYILALIARLDGKIDYAKTEEKEEQNRESVRFKVTLGVMPDYVFQGTGMRIDAVIPGRSAQTAGLKDGDIILKMGEIEVKDIYDYMDGLGKYELGDTITVIVKRGEEILERPVTFTP